MALQRIHTSQIKSTSTSYTSFKEQLNGMSIPYFEVKIANEGQTNFTLSPGKYYSVGTGQLKVYYNGQITTAGVDKDYIEVNESEIQFNFPCYAGDIILMRIEGAGGGATTSDHVHYWNVVPSGVINGVNTVFTLPHIPRDGTVVVYINGVRQNPASFTISINELHLDEAPLTGSEILTDYIV